MTIFGDNEKKVVIGGKAPMHSAGQLTFENALPQTNLDFIDEIEIILSDIKDKTDNGTYYQDTNMDTQTNLALSMNKISDILTKRFGWSIRFTISLATAISTELTPPPEFNVLGGEYDEFEKNLNTYLKDKTVDKLKPDEMIDSRKNFLSYLDARRVSLAQLKEQIKSKGIIVDHANAMIHNVPKSYMGVIKFNPFYWFNNKREGAAKTVTPRNIVAAIIHEVGHQYTVISESVKKVMNAHMLLNTVHEVVNLERHTPVQGIKIMYKNLGGEEKLDSMNMIEMAVAVKNKYSTWSLDGDGVARFHSTEKEALADQFAARFGLGIELTELLVKEPSIGRQFTTIDQYLNYFDDNRFICALFLLFTNVYGLLMLTVIFLLDIPTIADLNKDRTYESYSRRIIKIKQDYVRQHRLLVKTGASEAKLARVKALYEKIESTEKQFKFNSKYFSDLLDKVSLGKLNSERLSLIYATEELVDNKLHMI